MEVGNHFLPFEGAVNTPAGKLLAVSPASVSAIFSEWDGKLKQTVLVLLLNSNRIIRIYEEDAPKALEDLGLSQFAGSWYLDLERDLG